MAERPLPPAAPVRPEPGIRVDVVVPHLDDGPAVVGEPRRTARVLARAARRCRGTPVPGTPAGPAAPSSACRADRARRRPGPNTGWLSSGSGSPARTRTSLVRVSPGDSEPTRIQSRASRSVSLPRGATRPSSAARSGSTEPRAFATASPMTTRSSSPRGNPGAMSSPMSTHVSGRFVTGTPPTSTTSRLNRPRCPTMPRRRTAPSRASRKTWIDWSSSSDIGSGSPCRRAAVRCEKAWHSTTREMAAHWRASESERVRASTRRGLAHRDCSLWTWCLVRPHTVAMAGVNGRLLSGSGRGERHRPMVAQLRRTRR